MKKSSLNRIALVALATLAMTAADRAVAESTDTRRIAPSRLEASARTQPPPPVFGWTGAYVGGNLGLAAARNWTDHPIDIPTFGFEQFVLSPAGVVGGVQAGYNWQAANWVFGLEADFQGSGQKDSNNCIQECVPFAPPSVSLFEHFNQKIGWFGTVRPRLGYTNGPTLFYVTGGLAYGQISTDFNFLFSNGGADTFSAAGSFTDTKVGWTVGGGLETQLFGNWTGKIEYLFIDFGSVSGMATSTGGTVGNFFVSSKVQDHIVRLGVNYKFGDPVYAYAPAGQAIYKAAPAAVAYNWSGFYVGGNVGGALARNPTEFMRRSGAGVLGHDESFYLTPVGWVGGAQIGFNWQAASNLVFGTEVDAQFSGQKDSDNCIFFCDNTPPASATNISQKVTSFGTVRGRLGWTNGQSLYYFTGGWALGRVETHASYNVVGNRSAGDFAANKSGWTVGGGLETPILGNWTGKIEYLYLDLGTVAGQFGCTTVSRCNMTSSIRDNVVRVGLNYKFGNPVVAKY